MKRTILIIVAVLAILAGHPAGRGQPASAPGGLPPKPEFVRTPASTGSPINFFRKLLSSNISERDELLKEKTLAQRAVLLAKIQEYEALNPVERELRLRQLQLHYFLLPLMKLPPSARSNQVALIPLSDRALVEERLQRWDLLPPPLQKELLEYESTRAYFVRLEHSTPSERQEILKQIPDQDRGQVEAKLQQWSQLPNPERQVQVERFNQFFDLNEEERKKVLGFLPSEERRQMEPVITAFDQLPLEQRQRCLDSFRRFTNFSTAERQRFLETAQRWRSLPAPERQAWRDLVTTLPPLPPGMILRPAR